MIRITVSGTRSSFMALSASDRGVVCKTSMARPTEFMTRRLSSKAVRVPSRVTPTTRGISYSQRRWSLLEGHERENHITRNDDVEEGRQGRDEPEEQREQAHPEVESS